MKRRDTPIEVKSIGGYPAYIFSDGRTIKVVSVQNIWVIQGKWWGKEQKRIYYRILTDRGVLEIYVLKQNGKTSWKLWRVVD